jgi:hypothetical protein
MTPAISDHSGDTAPKVVRTSVSLSKADYDEVCALAAKLDVSSAWVVRKAVERLLADREPLLRQTTAFPQ